MDSDEELDATVARTGDRVVVTIGDTHQEKLGIARLEYDLVTWESSGSTGAGTEKRQLRGKGYSLTQLIQDLKKAVEMLDAYERRIHVLKVKRASGGSAFPAGEAAELSLAEEEAEELRERIRCQLEIAGSSLAGKREMQLEKVNEEILRLEALRRSEWKSSADDDRPYSTVERG